MSVAVNFNPMAHKPSTGGSSSDQFPDGIFSFAIKKSSIVDTNDKTGKRLLFDLVCQDEDRMGKRYQMGLNIVNQSAQAQEIAAEELAALCTVCGHHAVLEQTGQLHGIPFKLQLVETTYTNAKGEEKPSNNHVLIMNMQEQNAEEIRAAMQAGGGAPGGAPTAPTAPAAAPAPTPAPTAPAAAPAAPNPTATPEPAPVAAQPKAQPDAPAAAAEQPAPAPTAPAAATAPAAGGPTPPWPGAATP